MTKFKKKKVSKLIGVCDGAKIIMTFVLIFDSLILILIFTFQDFG